VIQVFDLAQQIALVSLLSLQSQCKQQQQKRELAMKETNEKACDPKPAAAFAPAPPSEREEPREARPSPWPEHRRFWHRRIWRKPEHRSVGNDLKE
jgi:hypothetical protein